MVDNVAALRSSLQGVVVEDVSLHHMGRSRALVSGERVPVEYADVLSPREKLSYHMAADEPAPTYDKVHGFLMRPSSRASRLTI
jgi:hypothetical protein